MTNQNDSGPGSLRDAISAVNMDSAPSLIAFNLPGDFGGVHTITLTSLLPAIQNRTVTIDGTSQPGYRGLPLIQIIPAQQFNPSAMVAKGLVFINSSNSLVKGLCINQFVSNQIEVRGGGGNRFEDNFIGTDPSGTRDPRARPDIRGDGIVINESAQNIITRNLISANHAGVVVMNILPATSVVMSNFIQGNRIGTDLTGNYSIGNETGIGLGAASRVLIGGPNPAERNVISGNTESGIAFGISGSGNVVQGNYIGTKANGFDALPNNKYGIYIGTYNQSNLIGGTESGAGNVIAFNGWAGIGIDSTANSNAILSNSIFSNGGLGIDLAPTGPTANDPFDADAGANNLQNAPSLMSGNTYRDGSNVNGTLNSAPNASYRIEFFSNADCDPSNYGEGQVFVGSTNVTTDSSGNASFSAALRTGPLPNGYPTNVRADNGIPQIITATATELGQSSFAGQAVFRNTSEFSPCLRISPNGMAIIAKPPVVLQPPTGVIIQVPAQGSADLSISATGTPTIGIGGITLTYTIVVTNNGPFAATGVAVTDNLPDDVAFVSCNSSGKCGGTGNNRVVSFDVLAPNSSTTITIVTRVTRVMLGMEVRNTVTVNSLTPDPNPSNNTATVTNSAPKL